MNYFNTLWFLVLIHLFGNSLAKHGSETGSSQLFIGQYPIPSKTPAPLNINTNKVKNVNLPPIFFTALVFSNTKVINDGDSIKAIQTFPRATVTGGPLLNDTYIFHHINYFWSGNLSGPAASLIGGKDGVPLEPTAYWYNKKYGSFENSKNYRDGMVVLGFPVILKPLPSLLFVPFSKTLEKVRKSGSYANTNLAETFFWFYIYEYLKPKSTYYAYPGSYQDKKNSKIYYCATVIRYIPQSSSISETQFKKYFLTLKDSKGKQLTNAVPSHPQGNTPVIKAEGQSQIFIPL